MNTPLITLGPFDLLRVISAGGMGRVYEGRHRESEAPVAIKIMHAAAVGEQSQMIAFRDEAQAVASLDHPNIIRVFDYGAANQHVDAQSNGTIEWQARRHSRAHGRLWRTGGLPVSVWPFAGERSTSAGHSAIVRGDRT